MTKVEFLQGLEKRLKGLPKDDITSRIEFYSEMIDDRIEEGKKEEEAILEIGSIDDVVLQIAQDTPLLKLVKEKVLPKRKISGFEIFLLILGFPLWLPLLVTTFALLLVGYILLWVLVIAAYSIEIALIASSIVSLIGFFVDGFNYGYIGIFLLCAGLSIFMFFCCIGATKGTAKLARKIFLSIKRKIITRGE